MALNLRQQKFVDAYITSGNATSSAISAGYSAKTAEQIGSRLLRNVQIAERLTVAQAKASHNAGLTLENHLKRLNELADKAVVAEQFGPAVNAEVSRGKASGFYIERKEHSGTVAMKVEIVREGKRRKAKE